MSEYEDFRAAGNLLGSALDKYLDAGLAFQNSTLERKSTATPPLYHPSQTEFEMEFVAALEIKLQGVKVMIKKVQNHTFAPVYKLPSELLAHVFQILFESQRKRDWQYHPEAVSRVCSRWRQISLSCPSMWRRIILPFIRLLSDTHVIRGRLYASRAHPLPLDVCLNAPNTVADVPHTRPIGSFIHDIAPRIGSLEFDTHWKECNLILSSFLPKCKPGILKTLTTVHDSRLGVFFARAINLPGYLFQCHSVMQIGNSNAAREDFDQVLASVTTLRLSGFYPFWTSQAYHGLIELRLIRGALAPTNALISEEHLIGIIRASPTLRIFEFSLTIVEALPAESLVSPISLEHLEILNLAELAPNNLGTLLRWIYPGLKPLQLAIGPLPNDNPVDTPDDRSESDSSGCTTEARPGDSRPTTPCTPWLELPDNTITSFLARSQVTKLYTKAGGHKTMFHLLNICPRLKTLACSCFQSWNLHLLKRDGIFSSHPTLESLLILDSIFIAAPIPEVISETPALQRIIFWKCRYRDGNSFKPFCIDNLRATVGLKPNVGIIDCDPTHDWEIFAP